MNKTTTGLCLAILLVTDRVQGKSRDYTVLLCLRLNDE